MKTFERKKNTLRTNEMIAEEYEGNELPAQEWKISTARGACKLKGLRELCREEDGMGTVEIILIIVVLVGLVLVFKEQITGIVDDLFEKITKQTKKV